MLKWCEKGDSKGMAQSIEIELMRGRRGRKRDLMVGRTRMELISSMVGRNRMELIGSMVERTKMILLRVEKRRMR